MKNTQQKISDEENQDEKYYELEITPELEKYLLDVLDGKDILPQKYTDVEEMHRDILGHDYLNRGVKNENCTTSNLK